MTHAGIFATNFKISSTPFQNVVASSIHNSPQLSEFVGRNGISCIFFNSASEPV